ncbi:MAG: TonB family protein [Opitutales bacterium]|nr:TonB family protein [Opitutales bacterium]
MIRDNTRFGYYCSIALHTTIVVGAILWVVVKSIFPEEQHEPIDPFEIVEPPAPPISAPQPQPEPEPKIEQPPETKPLTKIELPPESEPEPEPTPPEPEPKPEPKPEPEPTPSPKPKKVEKPKPAPKKVSFQDFVKRNPKVNKKTTTRTKTRSAPKIANISATTTNISNISNIKSDVVGTSTAMQDVLSAYYSEIRRIAKSNWAIPPTAQMTDWVVVAFRVSKNGDVSGVKVQSSSGNAELEKSALSTMRSVSLPPPPDNKPHTLSIKFDLK